MVAEPRQVINPILSRLTVTNLQIHQQNYNPFTLTVLTKEVSRKTNTLGSISARGEDTSLRQHDPTCSGTLPASYPMSVLANLFGPKLSINFDEILSRTHGNFEEQNKVLEPSITIYCIIINAYYNYNCIINSQYNYYTYF